MKRSDRLVIATIFVMLFIVMVLQAGIYWNTKPQEEYELIPVIGTVNLTALEEAGYFNIESFSIEREGFFIPQEDTGFRRGPCEICEAIQRGEITPTSWEDAMWADNFTVILKDSLGEPLRLFVD